MKQVIVLLITLAYFVSPAFASDIIDVQLNTQEIKTGESLRLTVSISGDDLGSGEQKMKIPGIENFNIFSQSQGYNYQSINGQVSSVREFVLDLRPLGAGEFTLGPVQIGEEKDDETLSVKVNDLISKQSPSNISDDKIKPKQELEHGGEDDISLRKAAFPLLGIIFSLLGFLLMFYILLKQFFTKDFSAKQIEKKEKTSHGENKDYKKIYLKKFEDLEQKMHSISTQDFFREYNTLLREIMLHQGYGFVGQATLSELRKKREITMNPIFKIFESSYAHEFSGQKQSESIKSQRVKEIISQLKK